NLSLYEAICRATPLPVLLAGGITPENAAAIQHAAHPFGMDILTGIESGHGIKDAAKIQALMHALGRPAMASCP
nr:hypothetical protein [bacterium]